jgi:hypothetical protein
LVNILQNQERLRVAGLAIDSRGMARKKKIKPFRAVKAVKEMARDRIGAPRPKQVVPDRRKKKLAGKHKPTLEQLQDDET